MARSSCTVLPEGIHKPTPDARSENSLLIWEPGWISSGDSWAKSLASKKREEDSVTAISSVPPEQDKEVTDSLPTEAGAKVAPAPAAGNKTEKDGAFKNEEGKFHYVLDLLNTDEMCYSISESLYLSRRASCST